MSAFQVRYAAGDGVALVGDEAVALVRSAPTDPFVGVLWPVVQAGGDVIEVVESLVRHGVRTVPALAVLAPVGDRLHVVLRGDIVVEASTDAPGGSHRLDADGIATWLECPLIDGAVAVSFCLARAADGAASPAGTGLLRASRIDVALLPVSRAGRSPSPHLNGNGEGNGATLTFQDTTQDGGTEPEASSYRHLFEATVPPNPSGELIDAIVWGTPEEPANAADPVDDRTVSRPLRATREDAAPSDRIGPMVHAIRCGAGHLNAPQSGACRRCGATLPDQDPVTVPRPVLGLLRLSTGDVVSLDRDVVLGRGPKVTQDTAQRPHVVKVNNPSNDVSRNHVAVHLDGWHVLVEDLASTNGTLVQIPGEAPQRLRAHEPVPMPPGSEVLLADGISFVYEVEA